MKKEEEDNIDHKFKEGLSKAEDNIAFRNDDWDAMEKLLDKDKRRKGIVFYLPRIISSIAALLLLTLGFFFLRPATKTGVDKNDVANVKPSVTNNTKSNHANNNAADSAIKNSTLNNTINSNGSNLANNKKIIDKTSTFTAPSTRNTNVNGNKAGLKLPLSSANSSQLAANIYGNRAGKKAANRSTGLKETELSNQTEITGSNTSPLRDLESTPKQTNLSNTSTEVLAANGTNTLNSNTSLVTADLSTTDKQLDNNSKRYAAAVKQQQKKKSAVNALWPGNSLVLSVLTAPDINGVGSSFSRAQVGSTTGLMLSRGFGRRFTVSTGAMYAKKPYAASFSQYSTSYQFKINPTDVYADCRVLDIQINIDYRLYSKGRNMVAVGTGISSYFMLRENYKFDYNNSEATGPASYNISNQNQHILGVLNVNATYQRRINANFGLNIQPYMKLPLTNIGYGRVDLQSTGVAVGVSWYLTSNSAK
jgi:hypothetical protein